MTGHNLLYSAVAYLRTVSPVGILNLLQVAEIREDNDLPTAAISKAGSAYVIAYNPTFVRKHANTPVRFAAVLLHEIFHKIFSAFRISETRPGTSQMVANLAHDMMVNAIIHKLDKNLSTFFRSFYKAAVFPEQLLRPNAYIEDPRLKELYTRVWQNVDSITFEELIEHLERFLRRQQSWDIVFIGSHDINGTSASNSPKEGTASARDRHLKTLANELADALAEAGCSQHEFVRRVRRIRIHTNRDLDEAMRHALVASQVTRIVRSVIPEECRDHRTVMPLAYGARECFLLNQGIYPVFFPQWEDSDQDFQAVHVYIDVSGSVADIYDVMYGALLGLKRYLHPEAYLFSNKVWPVRLYDLERGMLRTTHGTDFDCVFEHWLSMKMPPRKVLMFTDGIASLSTLYQQKKRDLDLVCIAALTPGGQDAALRTFCDKIIRIQHWGGSS